MIRIIRIEFADPRIKAIDHIDDLHEAVDHAWKNLYLRHGVMLSYPEIKDGQVLIGIDLPDAYKENFRIGPHLRGVSSYLLAKFPKRYSNHRIGTRLLYFMDS